MSAERACERELLGPYLLGQLGDTEAERVRGHLRTCAGCREEAAALAPIARLLDHADPDRVEAPPSLPPPELGATVVDMVADRLRRRRRIRLGAALAAATVAIAVAVTLPVGGGTAGHLELEFTGVPAGAELTASLEPRSFGTELGFRVRGFRPGVRCRVRVRLRDGRTIAAGSFRYRYEDGSDAARLTTAKPISDFAAVEVSVAEGTYEAPVTAGIDQ